MTKEYYELRNNRISKVHKEIIDETLNWFATNIDSYPSMELEEEK